MEDRKGADHLKVTGPATVAGGIPAVVHAAAHVFREVGVVDGTRAMLRINQFDGFDCPGCAWPDPDHERSAVEFCENGAKAVAEEATTERCDDAFFARHAVSEMMEWTDYALGKSGRIVAPMVLEAGSDHYRPIGWPEAFRLVADGLKALASPHEAVFYTSGRTSNEAAFLYQLMVRMYGTNNLPDCSNMCHESSGVALTETVGIGKGSVTLDDFYNTELIIIAGQNPGTNHPRMLTALQKAKANGTRIIAVNPLEEAGLIGFRHPQHPLDMVGKPTTITDLWLQVRVNEDVALFKAILKLLLERAAVDPAIIDHDFMEKNTSGYAALVADLARYDTGALIQRSGVPREKVEEAVSWIAASRKIIICWAMGLTQHQNAVDNIRELVNLLLLKGSIGKPGAGTCPVRGHSNVQGDRTMGIYEKPGAPFLDSLGKVFGFEPPRAFGYDTVESIQAMAEGKVRVFMAMGGNFVSATPDTSFTARALQRCDLTVHVSTKLNRTHLVRGRVSLILPCLGRTERDLQQGKPQFVTVENSAGVVHLSKGEKTPASPHLLSEPRIVAGIAQALWGTSRLDWNKLVDDYDHVRDLIERTIPGFDRYNTRVRKPGGFYLPNGAREGTFKTPSERAIFTLNTPALHDLQPGEFLMMTIRSHDQYNTTIYGMNDRYRGIHHGRRVIFMNESDITRAGFKAGDKLDILSYYDGVVRQARAFTIVSYQIPSGNVATYFPEANEVVPHNRFAHRSQTPISKSVVVKLRPTN